jgi:hypothetical protein
MEKLLNLNRYALYAILVITVVAPLLFVKGAKIPTLTSSNTEDLYIAYMNLPEGSTVLLETDWTISTRGENKGQFLALMKVLKYRKVKFVMYSMSSPQSVPVAKKTIDELNVRLKANGLDTINEYEDYVQAGFFPDIDAFYNAVKLNPRNAFGKKKVNVPGTSESVDIMDSPVLKDIKDIKDFKMVINVSASGTLKNIVQRIYGQIPIASMVTGVMGPEALNYYASKQIVGLSVGLRGVAELETMLKEGVNYAPKEGMRPEVEAPQYAGVIQPMDPKWEPFDIGMKYFLSLHTALGLLIFAVVLGNIGMLSQKKRKSK